MEIEKTRETSWKIQLERKNESIELTSVEISGEVRAIKLTLFKEDNSLMSEMNKEEFFNFLSLISAPGRAGKGSVVDVRAGCRLESWGDSASDNSPPNDPSSDHPATHANRPADLRTENRERER